MINEEARERLDIIITRHEIDDENVTITNERDYEAMRVAIKALEQQTCEDAVSRQAVLDIFADNADAVRPYSKTWEEVKALPSVNPQPICEEREKGECPYYAG